MTRHSVYDDLSPLDAVEPANTRDECLVAGCTSRATVLLGLYSLGDWRKGWFCEACAPNFEGCWVRLQAEPAAGEQLTLAPDMAVG